MTSTARVSLQAAWILHHYPYRDSSLLLEVFSREHGRVGLVARGARAARGRWHNQLQMLRPLWLSWNLRGELGTLTDVDSRAHAPLVAGRQVLSACYLNELLLRLLSRHDPHPGLFDAYEQALTRLPTAEEQALRCFEKQLLQELGYGLQLDCEADGVTPVLAGARYEYRLEGGPVRCAEPLADGIYLDGASLLALRDEQLDSPHACREVKTLMRAALAVYLGTRPLKTRTVSRQLSALTRSDPQAVGDQGVRVLEIPTT
jgi:DNA repair protein RecO (recombination protein O)